MAVVSEISSVSVVVPGSNGQQSGCGAASFTSKSKSKRISIADRRELLESFVNKYVSFHLLAFFFCY